MKHTLWDSLLSFILRGLRGKTDCNHLSKWNRHGGRWNWKVFPHCPYLIVSKALCFFISTTAKEAQIPQNPDHVCSQQHCFPCLAIWLFLIMWNCVSTHYYVHVMDDTWSSQDNSDAGSSSPSTLFDPGLFIFFWCAKASFLIFSCLYRSSCLSRARVTSVMPNLIFYINSENADLRSHPGTINPSP